MWHWQKDRNKGPSVGSCQVNDAGTTRYLYINKKNNNPYLTQNSKCITDLHVSAKTIKLLDKWDR